jgi:hypothetical protein
MSTRILAVAAIGLWVVTAAVAVAFFVRGQTRVASDGRTAVLLTPDERDLVLSEMRGVLASVQSIVEAVNAGDMKRVAEAARDGGMAAAADVNPALMAKLPLEFKELGFGMHRHFDELAAAADSGASREEVLGSLSAQLSTCVGCHAGFRLEAITLPRP